jgi:oxygen-independent coproporphyrinogen-3 oxidase
MFGLYIHIPYCMGKCPYCDFTSQPFTPGEIDVYLSALVEELAVFSRGNRRIVETLYVGGGTPSILSRDQLTALFTAIREFFTLLDDAEITLEINPGTVDSAKALHLRALGVNRVSLGVQSLRDSFLSRLGRRHTAKEAIEAMNLLRRAGFTNVGVDLMYGLPGQSHADWVADLDGIMAFNPEHLSLYCLSIEKATPFAQAQQEGRLVLPADGETVRMFQSAREKTEHAGYDHYEISNYARPGYRSRHNSLYWTMQEYYGAGAGAHSFFRMDGPIRLSNDADPRSYVRKMGSTKDPVARRELLQRKTYLAEALMLGLRMMDGIDIGRFCREYGVDPLAYFSKGLRRALDNGWIDLVEGRFRLTYSGMLFSNEVFVDLF